MCAGGNIFHGAMGLDSLFLMRPVKGWYVYLVMKCYWKIHIWHKSKWCCRIKKCFSLSLE